MPGSDMSRGGGSTRGGEGLPDLLSLIARLGTQVMYVFVNVFAFVNVFVFVFVFGRAQTHVYKNHNYREKSSKKMRFGFS